MATLRNLKDARSWSLMAEELVGRSKTCDWLLSDRDVSGRHALVRWTGRVWALQDLGSRNGTFVRDVRLDPSERVTLLPGMHVRFGATDEWAVVDVAPPCLLAISGSDRHRISESDGILALPSEDDPQVVIHRDQTGRWVCESELGTHPIDRTRPLVAGGQEWRVCVVESTPETYQPAASFDDLSLEFKVSTNEEHIDLTAIVSGKRMKVASRAHHYTLLTLARALLKDVNSGQQPPAAQGWVDQETLGRMLRKDETHLNVEIHRARRQFAELGIAGSVRLIERRRGTGELRLGCARLSVERI